MQPDPNRALTLLPPEQSKVADAVKLTVDKFADGDIVCLKFTGSIDESFGGKKLAVGIKATTLLLDVGGVKKISSFGIREWVDFVTAAGKQVAKMVLIECPPKVVDQLNMVANFAGGGAVFSLYAPFRCDFCDSEHRVLMQLDRDFDLIKTMKIADRACPSCQESMYFDEDGAAFFSHVLTQGRFELAPDAVHFLSAKLNYAVNDVGRKFKVDKLLDGQATYFRFHGDLNQTFPKDKLADGLEGTVIVDLLGVGRIEPAGAALWRGFVTMVTPLVKELYLIGAPAAFVEKLAGRDDLGTKTQVLSISMPYACTSCGTSGGQWIDVATHYAVLTMATAPEVTCTHCKTSMACMASESMMTVLPELPMPTASAAQQGLIKNMRERKPVVAKVVTTPATVIVTARSPWWMPVSSAVLAVALGAVGYFGYQAWSARAQAPAGVGKVVTASETQRPVWVNSDVQGSVSCAQNTSTEITCTGVSSLSQDKDDAIDEASDAAMEALGNALAMQMTDARWQSALPPIWQATRAAKLAAFDRDSGSSQARRDVRQGRRAVARLLRATAVGIVPAAPLAKYWEQYKMPGGNQYLAFIQLTLPATNVAMLVERYQQSSNALGATVVSAFPLLGWRYPDMSVGGAVVVDVTQGRLKNRGLTSGYVLLDVGGRAITDAASFAKFVELEMQRLDLVGGTLALTVQSGDTEPRSFQDMVDKKSAPVTGRAGNVRAPVTSPDNTNVNVWDRVGGGSAGSRDDPNQ